MFIDSSGVHPQASASFFDALLALCVGAEIEAALNFVGNYSTLGVEQKVFRCYTSPMSKYELTIVMDAKLTPSKRKTVREIIEKTVSLLRGKVGTVLDWGEKELAYKIKAKSGGYFLHLPIELSPDSAKKLTEKIKTEDAIIRYLLVRI